MLRFLLALGVLAGCAAPPALLPMAEVLPTVTSASVVLSPLASVQQAVLPPALRPSSAPTTDASSMVAMPADTPLGNALSAYLLIHAALASDTIDGVADAAREFETAFRLAIEDAPADDPHVWHMRANETAAVQTHASSLARATDLVGARSAFSELSAPFASLIEVVGPPDGFDLVRHTCGMPSDAPEGGVWLQRAGDVRNPYVGGAMPMCARESSPLSDGIDTDPAAHTGMTHGSR